MQVFRIGRLPVQNADEAPELPFDDELDPGDNECE